MAAYVAATSGFADGTGSPRRVDSNGAATSGRGGDDQQASGRTTAKVRVTRQPPPGPGRRRACCGSRRGVMQVGHVAGDGALCPALPGRDVWAAGEVCVGDTAYDADLQYASARQENDLLLKLARRIIGAGFDVPSGDGR